VSAERVRVTSAPKSAVVDDRMLVVCGGVDVCAPAEGREHGARQRGGASGWERAPRPRQGPVLKT
jgi:hypothetical protein